MRTRLRKLWIAAMFVAAALTLGCPPKKPNPCRNPEYVEAMKEQAKSFYSRGDYIEALKSVKEADACNPDDAELYYWMGLIYFQRNKPYDAMESFKKSLEIDPQYVESSMALGMVCLELQRWDEAIAQYKIAADNDYFKRPWEAYSNMGWAYLQKGEYDQAEQSLKQAVKLNANFCPAYTNLGELYSKQNNRQKAIYYFQKAINLCPANYARPHFLMGIEYAYENDYDRACKEFAAAAVVPNAAEADKAMDYVRLYNCPGVVMPAPGP